MKRELEFLPLDSNFNLKVRDLPSPLLSTSSSSICPSSPTTTTTTTASSANFSIQSYTSLPHPSSAMIKSLPNSPSSSPSASSTNRYFATTSTSMVSPSLASS